MKQQTNGELERRLKRLNAWLSVYRAKVSEELVEEYCRKLAGLTPHEFDVGLDKAAEENPHPGFIPDPALILNIAADMRSGATYTERECPDCRGTGFQVRQTLKGRVAVPCHCMSEDTRQKVEAELNKPVYHSAEVFAKQERRRFISGPLGAPKPTPKPPARPQPEKSSRTPPNVKAAHSRSRP